MVEFSCWDFGVLECVEKHPATISAVSMIVSALGVLLAAIIAYRGARLQGQSALEAAKAQIEHSVEREAATARDKKLGVASILVAEINLIIIQVNAIRKSANACPIVDLDKLVFLTPVYDKMMVDVPCLGGKLTGLIVSFYKVLYFHNEHQRGVILHSQESGESTEIITGEKLQNALESLDMPYRMAEKLSHDLSQMITELGGSPPVRANQAPQSPDQDPGPAAT